MPSRKKPHRKPKPKPPRFEVGQQVCAPGVAGLDPFTVFLIISAPHRGFVDLEELDGTKAIHNGVPIDHLALL